MSHLPLNPVGHPAADPSEQHLFETWALQFGGYDQSAIARRDTMSGSYVGTLRWDWAVWQAARKAPRPGSSDAGIEGWKVPHLVSFKGVVRTSCPKHLQDDLEGTVAWSVSMFGQGVKVTDRYGVVHESMPLGLITDPS